MSAITVADRIHARSPAFRRRVDRALRLISEHVEAGHVIGVSFSGGKDSTVLLDLVRRVVPDVPAAFFDCSCELRQTYDIVRHYGIDVIETEISLIDLCKAGGYWGYRDEEVDIDLDIDFSYWLIDEPAKHFAESYGLDTIALGLRAGESKARRLNAVSRGELYMTKVGRWHLCPLAYWSDADVWAYIADRGLAYNAAYDCMAELGIPRQEWRISSLLGADAATHGRFARLRQIDPNAYNRLASVFPMIARYT